MPLFVPAFDSFASAAYWSERFFFNDLDANLLTFSDCSKFDPANGEILIGGTVNQIGLVTNVRKKWTPLTFPDAGEGFGAGAILSPVRDPITQDIYCIVDSAGSGELAKSTDAGVSWTDVTPPTVVAQMRGVVITSNGRIWVNADTQGTNLFFSDDNGATWTDDSDDIIGAGATRSPIQVSPNGDRIVVFANANIRWASSVDINEAFPVLTQFNMNTILGSAFGPGSLKARQADFSSDGTVFFGAGQFGDMFFTTDFVSFTAIPDANVPLYIGSNTGSKNIVTIFSPFHNGFFVMNDSDDGLAFFPADDLVNPLALMLSDGAAGNLNGAMNTTGDGFFLNGISNEIISPSFNFRP